MKTQSLNHIDKNNPFKVPENYFDTLGIHIKNEVSLIDLVSEINAFDVPKNYFPNLKEQVIAQTTLPLVRNNTFKIPNRFFEKNKIDILSKINFPKQKLTKTITLAFVRYAAAACILLTTSLGIYVNSTTIETDVKALSKIPTEDLEFYLQQNVDGVDIQTIMENMPSETVFSIEKSEFKQQDISEYLEISQ